MLGGFSIIEERTEEGKVALLLSGELDTAQTDQLRSAVERCEDAEQVVLDTTRLDFIDSAGLSALIDAHDRLGPDRFTLIPGETTRRLLEITGTADLLLPS